MKNSRILLSALTAGILCSTSFGENSEINWHRNDTDTPNWTRCDDPTACSDVYVAGEYSANGNASGAVVKTDADREMIYGGYADNGDVSKNTVIVENGQISTAVIGGTSKKGNIIDNTVIIENTDNSWSATGAQDSSSGNTDIYAKNNKVIIKNGKILYVEAVSGRSAHTTAEGNIVEILGGTVDAARLISNGKSAIDNVFLYRGGQVKRLIGILENGVTNYSGNQLIIANTGLSANSVSGFQEYFFALPTDIKANDTMLTLSEKLTFNTGDKVGVATQGDLANLKIGESVTLIKGVEEGENSFKADMYAPKLEAKYKDKDLLIDTTYKFELSQEGNSLNAELTGREQKSNEESKALSEGTAGAAAAVIEAGSVMADKGISAAMNQANVGGGKAIDNFGAIGFGSSRYQTGSYVDSKSINISVGVALGQEVKYGKVLVGPFIELGYSDYETHNDFSTGHVRGDGISKYLGGGVFARYDWNSYDNGHPYVEGSIRFGRNKNSFDSTDMGQSYKSNAFYYGAHLGLGYIVEFQNNSNLDFYAKYFYTHLNSDDVTTNKGANLNLDAVNSHKTRFGARYNHALNNSSEWQIKPYVGLAWEHEYKGAANATTSSYAIEAPSLEGSSGLAEIGVNIGKEKGLSADLGVAGYTGKRRGVAGNIMVKYEF